MFRLDVMEKASSLGKSSGVVIPCTLRWGYFKSKASTRLFPVLSFKGTTQAYFDSTLIREKKTIPIVDPLQRLHIHKLALPLFVLPIDNHPIAFKAFPDRFVKCFRQLRFEPFLRGRRFHASDACNIDQRNQRCDRG